MQGRGKRERIAKRIRVMVMVLVVSLPKTEAGFERVSAAMLAKKLNRSVNMIFRVTNTHEHADDVRRAKQSPLEWRARGRRVYVRLSGLSIWACRAHRAHVAVTVAENNCH